MDAAASHHVNVITTRVRSRNENSLFQYGIAVFEPLPATHAPPADGAAAHEAVADEDVNGAKPAAATDEDGASEGFIEAGTIFVKQRKTQTCFHCGDAGHAKAECPKNGQHRCRECQSWGHKRAECPEVCCRTCGERGHQASACASKQCFNCGATGHEKKNCLQSPADRSVCAHCHAPKGSFGGHSDDDCPTRSAAAATTTTTTDGASMEAEPAPEKTAEEEEPLDCFKQEPGTHLSVKLTVDVVAEHISSLSLQLLASYDDAQASRKGCNHAAVVRFTAANTTGPLQVRPAGLEDDEVLRLLRPSTVDHVRAVQSGSREDRPLELYHIQWEFDGSKSAQLGLGMFAERSFGPYSAVFSGLRDLLLAKRRVAVHFFALSYEDLPTRVEDLEASFRSQRQETPLLAWYTNGKLNVQKGTQLPEDARPQYTIPARLQFDNDDEYLTVMFYSAVAELETIESSKYVRSIIRLVRFGGYKESAYGAVLEMADGLEVRPDASLSVRFLGEDAASELDWRGLAVAPMPWATVYEHSLFITRPCRDGQLIATPEFAEEDIIDVRDHTVEGLRQQLFSHPGIEVLVKVDQPKSHLEREINTLRHMSLTRAAYKHELGVLRNNAPIQLVECSYFAADEAKHGAEEVRGARSFAEGWCRLEDKQLAFFLALESMRGSVFVVQGPGGVGKSKLFEALAVYQYTLQARAGEACRLWLVSPLNDQGTALATRIMDTLLAVYQHEGGAERQWKYPLVIRRHMRATERKIVERSAVERRRAQGIDADLYAAAAADADDDDNNDEASLLGLTELHANYKLRTAYETHGRTRTDRRMRNLELSEGYLALAFAGVRGPGGEAHPIEHPDRARFASFRRLLEEHAMGADWGPEQRSALTLALNEVLEALAEAADVIFMTPHVLSESRSHTISTARALLFDEAGKASERAALNSLVYTRPYSVGPGGVQVSDAPPVPCVMAGDMYQPKPAVGRAGGAPFVEQTSVSLFTRMLLGAAPQLWLDKQHRYVKDIADLVNQIHSGEPLTTDPAVELRPAAQRIRDLFLELAGIRGSCLYLSIDGDAETNDKSQSKFNRTNVQRVMYIVMFALQKHGFAGEDIVVATGYTAQLHLYLTAQHAMVDNYSASPEGAELARRAKQVRFVTIDSIQGAQAPLVVVDTVVSAELGFLRENARMGLAVTRPESGLLLVGNERGVDEANKNNKAYRSTAYYKIAHYCKQRKWYVNTGHSKNKSAFEKWEPPFSLEGSIEAVHRARQAGGQPKCFADDNVFQPPAFAVGLAGEQEETMDDSSGSWGAGDGRGASEGDGALEVESWNADEEGQVGGNGGW